MFSHNYCYAMHIYIGGRLSSNMWSMCNRETLIIITMCTYGNYIVIVFAMVS